MSIAYNQHTARTLGGTAPETRALTDVEDHWNPTVMYGDFAHIEDFPNAFLCMSKNVSTQPLTGNKPLFLQKVAPLWIAFSDKARNQSLRTFHPPAATRLSCKFVWLSLPSIPIGDRPLKCQAGSLGSHAKPQHSRQINTKTLLITIILSIYSEQQTPLKYDGDFICTRRHVCQTRIYSGLI